MVAPLVGSLYLRRRVPRGGPDLADRPQGLDLGDDRRADRRADDVVARRPRRRAQLGLSLLLVARRRADARGPADRRLRRGGAHLPRLPGTGRHRRPRRHPDHVRHRGRAPPDRVRARAPAGLRGRATDPRRQRSLRAVSARRLRRVGRRQLSRRDPARAHRPACWPRWRVLVDYVETVWRKPDDGIWEARGGPKHYTYSKVMAWVVFDRAIRLAERFGLESPVARWTATRDAIHGRSAIAAMTPRATRSPRPTTRRSSTPAR